MRINSARAANDGGLRVVSAAEVRGLLYGREPAVIETVRRAYLTHAAGHTALPDAPFLRLPGDERNRIIALPAYVGDEIDAVGIKWIASVPANLEHGMPRASAVLLLNSVRTGRVLAVIEASAISAWRTAASAALAAAHLRSANRPVRVGLIGCGPINAEIVRFLSTTLPVDPDIVVFDIDAARAAAFSEYWSGRLAGLTLRVVAGVEAVLQHASMVSFATTAARPHVDNVSSCSAGTTILHISLRDLAPEVLLECDNVVDDIHHVCRAGTSLRLGEELVGTRNFIRCTLGDILRGAEPGRRTEGGTTIFSPFGMGILDVAVGALVLELAEQRGVGCVVEEFSDAGRG